MKRNYFILICLLAGMVVSSCETTDSVFAWPEYSFYVKNSTNTDLKVKVSTFIFKNDADTHEDTTLVVHAKDKVKLETLNGYPKDAVTSVAVYTTKDSLYKEFKKDNIPSEIKCDSIPDNKNPGEYGYTAYYYTFIITDEMIKKE